MSDGTCGTCGWVGDLYSHGAAHCIDWLKRSRDEVGLALASTRSEVARLTEERDEARAEMESDEYADNCRNAMVQFKTERDAARSERASLEERLDAALAKVHEMREALRALWLASTMIMWPSGGREVVALATAVNNARAALAASPGKEPAPVEGNSKLSTNSGATRE